MTSHACTLPIWRCHHISSNARGALLATALFAVVDQICVHGMGHVANGEHATFSLGVSGGAMLHGDNCSKTRKKLETFTVLYKYMYIRYIYIYNACIPLWFLKCDKRLLLLWTLIPLYPASRNGLLLHSALANKKIKHTEVRGQHSLLCCKPKLPTRQLGKFAQKM